MQRRALIYETTLCCVFECSSTFSSCRFCGVTFLKKQLYTSNREKDRNWTDLSKTKRVLRRQLLLPGQEGGGLEEGDGGGSALLSYEAAAPFGPGPGLWEWGGRKTNVSQAMAYMRLKQMAGVVCMTSETEDSKVEK